VIRAALITSGGRGTRIGGPLPKQYLALKGIPILARTLTIFHEHPLVDRIVVTVPQGNERFCRERIVAPFNLSKVVDIVPGGPDRQASVYNGLLKLSETDLVAIHDGVRPLVSATIIADAFSSAEAYGAAVACVPVRETVKKKTASSIETIAREDLWLAHTPQTFRTSLICEAHERALDDDFRGTDDASLVERLGYRVMIVPDLDDNIKITTRADLELARFLLDRRETPTITFGEPR
jgi:2-C-methyl-D-erythritol 4-phosphate cytidylyltransferase